MANRSKDKGKRGERELTRILSEIFGGSFQRVPNSGAFVGGLNAARRQELSETQVRTAKGDIITPDHLPHMVIEAKSYGCFLFHQMVQQDGSPLLDGWIEQTLDAADEDDVWFLAFKINRIGWFVCFDPHLVGEVEIGNHARYRGYAVTEMLPFLRRNRDQIIDICTSSLRGTSP